MTVWNWMRLTTLVVAFASAGSGPVALAEKTDQMDEYKVVATSFPEAKKGGEFTTRIGTYPRTLNRWRAASDLYTGAIAEMVTQSLLDTDLETFQEIPGVAKAWKLADDKMSVTFYIDEKARWWDGTEITADDVIFTWDTTFNEKNDTAPARGFYDAIKSWEKIDKHTVKINFARLHFENVSRAGGYAIMQKKFYSAKNFDKDYNNTIVGSGPYIFDEKDSKKGRKIVLRRNKDWWGDKVERYKNLYNFDKVVYRVIEDDRVAFEAFKKGELSWFEFSGDGLDIWAKEVVNSKQFDGTGDFAKLEWQKANPFTWGGVALNMRRGPTADLKFREALQILFNSELYTQKIFHGLQAPLLGPFGNYSPYASPNRKIMKFDPEAVKKNMQELGYTQTDDDGVLYRTKDGAKQRAEIDIIFAYLPHEKYLTIFKEDAGKVGIKVNLKFMEWAAGSKLVDEFKFDAFVMGWGGNPVPAPSQLWSGKFAMEKASSNIPGFADKKADELIAAAPAEFDLENRYKLFHELEDIIVAANPYLWRWQQTNHHFVYNKKLLAVPDKIWKYSGDNLRGQPWYFWWHAKAKDSKAH